VTDKYEPIHLLESAKQTGPRPDALLQVKEVAKLLGVHPNTVRSWTDCGVLRSYRIGPRRDRRVPLDAVRGILDHR
jgi:excisionase family DNA binding protein